ncbi:MAG TPA: RNA polymerase sigma factor [Holophagaceae bacterium]|nr:RNA polymerase sigma factor [Holophagaceae bacterium]
MAVPSGMSGRDPLDAVAHRAREGEPGAFEELMALTDLKVLGVAWRILGDRDQARDAAQEVYLRIYRSLAGYRPTEGFRAWMHRITVNVCFDHMRKRGPRMASFEDQEGLDHAHPGGEHPEEALLLDQRRALVRQALQTLPAAERAALVLRDLEGLSTEEAAKALGVRPATVRSQISNARAKVQAFCARRTRPAAGGRP